MSQHTHSQHDPIREDVESRQRNTVWPDPMRNASTVDEYLWKGNPKAPTVQRVGAAIFGVMFLIFAGMFIYMAAEEKVWLLYLVSLAPGYIGLRTLRNGFKLS